MDLEQFTAYGKAIDIKAWTILEQANAEYANAANKFQNFDEAANLLSKYVPELANIKPQHVAFIYFFKHLTSILNGVSIRENMDGRYIDAMNYLRLIMGMDERDRQEATK